MRTRHSPNTGADSYADDVFFQHVLGPDAASARVNEVAAAIIRAAEAQRENRDVRYLTGMGGCFWHVRMIAAIENMVSEAMPDIAKGKWPVLLVSSQWDQIDVKVAFRAHLDALVGYGVFDAPPADLARLIAELPDHPVSLVEAAVRAFAERGVDAADAAALPTSGGPAPALYGALVASIDSSMGPTRIYFNGADLAKDEALTLATKATLQHRYRVFCAPDPDPVAAPAPR